MVVFSPLHILTFDIEDWFHLLDHEQTANEHLWSCFPSRVERNTDLILRSLSDRSIKATFFCLGWIGRNHPQVIKSIHDSGHEIGSHSDQHALVFRMNPREFREDLRRSIGVLEDLTGRKVKAYRAPGFSITEQSKWAIPLLAENGIEWDSSIFASSHSHGGLPEFPWRVPTIVEHDGAQLKQFPVVPGLLSGRQINFAGGGYFRLLPYPLVRHLMRNSAYATIYFHPRDFDPDQPRVQGLSSLRLFKSYVGLNSSLKKLDALLADFKFVSIGEAEAMIDWTKQPIYRFSSSIQSREERSRAA